MSADSFRQRLLSGECVVGTFQLLDSTMVSEMIGVAGMDFVVYDQEHGPLTAETTLELSTAAQNEDVAPIVRVRENTESEIQRALDIGTAGVQVPQVETREEAEAAVEAARFGPLGSRGLSQYVRAGDYVGGESYTEDQNDETLLVIQVEGERGVENIDEILQVDGIDVVFLGPYDLSQSLGIPGQVTDDRVEDLMRRVCERAAETETVVGAFADDAETANKWMDAGVQYLTLGVEVGLFTEHLSDVVADVDVPRTE
ncbi:MULTISPECIES: aldolase/citrate lyase family protein [unclassified Haladaptatus]|uniref:HpcH/HpaI aldolase family protein n=1 Tax=unclassified Haladaptatus TaxID=2622732 RepID=UPI00209BD660|nr:MULTISPECIES: aldolase/citrate lyase family protein [unclassified Haladaptatus]MCO8243399.1 aldolase/citrate lyase family protein [Haladaptatus sp. AB643]MCO8254806.1 aldolase/citrate lyase family protein [Haladaptatus sp. AB618]